MKIRVGFVSNSSSSSFCIMGCYVNDLNINDDVILNMITEYGYDDKLKELCETNNYGTISDVIEQIKNNTTDIPFEELMYFYFKDSFIKYDGNSEAGIQNIIGVDLLLLFDKEFNGDGNKMKKYVLDYIHKLDPTVENVVISMESYCDG